MISENSKAGFVLVAVTVVMAVLILLAFYFLDFVIIDSKISQSHNLSTQTYYLAEAGIQEAIWRIKSEPTWRINFQTNPSWSANFSRQNPFGQNSSYQVTIQNTDLAEAEITATGLYQIGQSTAQRIVKTKVFQALNPTPISGVTIFTNNDIDLTGTVMTVSGGSIFSNDDINLFLLSNLTVTEDVSAVDKINISWTSNITSKGRYSTNYPPAPSSLEMPQIDFDSKNPNSYLNQADYVYTTAQFNKLMDSGSLINLTGIIYVQGNAIIPRGKTLTINGLLVADGNINLGTDWWPLWLSNPSIIINNIPGKPSGILTKRKINVGSFIDTVSVNGLIYATDEVKLDAFGGNFNLTGGIIAGSFKINSLLFPLTITYNESLVATTLGNPQTSPIINIEHWEEEY